MKHTFVPFFEIVANFDAITEAFEASAYGCRINTNTPPIIPPRASADNSLEGEAAAAGGGGGTMGGAAAEPPLHASLVVMT